MSKRVTQTRQSKEVKESVNAYEKSIFFLVPNIIHEFGLEFTASVGAITDYCLNFNHS